MIHSSKKIRWFLRLPRKGRLSTPGSVEGKNANSADSNDV
jgi:hypothetical protein